MKLIRPFFLSVALIAPLVASAAELKSTVPSNQEAFHYSWRLRGGLSWIAGLIFPRSGVGALKTTRSDSTISSELLITSPNDEKNGFYLYQSKMDAAGNKTLMTYHGYAWGNRSRKERTVFDYVRRLAHMHKETPTKVEDKVKPLPDDQLRDILTAIYFLRQHADTIKAPIMTTIYSDGKQYPVVFKPAGKATFTIGADKVSASAFQVVSAPGEDRRFGGVTVWISDDARRIPCRIEIAESLASLQLDLQSVESYALLK